MRRGNCKSRAVRHETYHVGDGAAEKAFVHVEVRFLEGRPADTKQPVGREILRILQDHYRPSLERLDLQITVEVGEIARRLYFKIPEGTLSQPEDRHAYA
jgi:5-carboxymethyl-2-hydroxymuconate isomerase